MPSSSQRLLAKVDWQSAQAALMLHLGIDYPRTLAFNDPEIALENWEAGWPALLKPEQGGSGARMYLLNSVDEFPQLFRERPDPVLPESPSYCRNIFPVIRRVA